MTNSTDIDPGGPRASNPTEARAASRAVRRRIGNNARRRASFPSADREPASPLEPG